MAWECIPASDLNSRSGALPREQKGYSIRLLYSVRQEGVVFPKGGYRSTAQKTYTQSIPQSKQKILEEKRRKPRIKTNPNKI
jgi:hypothetical protein